MINTINKSKLSTDEKEYWKNILPIMDEKQKNYLKQILNKMEWLAEFNEDLFIWWEEK